MKTIYTYLATVLSIVFLAACATTPQETKSAYAPSGAPQAKIDYLSLRLQKANVIDKCPSHNSWQKESLAVLIEYSNSCAQVKKTEKLEALAAFLAQKYSSDMWGPYYFGLSAEVKKEYPRALWMIELAIKKQPKSALLHYEKGRLLWAASQFDGVLSELNLAAQLDSQFADAQLALAQWYFQNQDYKQSKKYFNNMTSLEPMNSQVFIGLAESYLALNERENAIHAYELAVDLNPNSIDYKLQLVKLYETDKKYNVQTLSLYRKIHSLVSGQRFPSNDLDFDINDKIKKYEDILEANNKNKLNANKKVVKK
jgi:tetratricopeptide (TPR) repeat protein